MKTEIEGKMQLKCDGCSELISESSYYPSKRGAINLSLKNSEGDYESYDLHNESCARTFLNSRHEAFNKGVKIEASEEISFGRDGMVTLDFSTALKNKEKKA